MTPESLSERDEEALRDILRAIEKVEQRAARGRGAFDGDEVLQDSVVRQLQIIGQATKRLSESLKGRYSGVPWRDVAGMRDVLVHDYADVDLDAVWSAVEKDIPPLKATVIQALESSGKGEPG